MSPVPQFPGPDTPAPPPVPLLAGEMIPDPRASRQLWHVQPFTPDGHVAAPCGGVWPAFTPEEALQSITAQARADGWPVAALRWSVRPADAGPDPEGFVTPYLAPEAES